MGPIQVTAPTAVEVKTERASHSVLSVQNIAQFDPHGTGIYCAKS
jgi:hypothetical protein